MTTTIMEPQYTHDSVLKDEVVSYLIRSKAGLYLDATVGLGGHAELVLEKAPQARLLGLDLDPEALALASKRLARFGERAKLAKGNFRSVGAILEQEGFTPLTGVLFDLGVSSLQFDKASRGFSFQESGPLDMRLDPESPLTAGRIVNDWPVEQLSLLLKEYGEEREAGRIARWIAQERVKKPFKTTLDLSRLIESKLGRRGGTHPATRTFMALRIAVNHELENLSRGVESVLPFIERGGAIVVISFHSLEDRIVKNVFKSFEAHGLGRVLTPSPVSATSREVEKNPRARSAKLRAMEKT